MFVARTLVLGVTALSTALLLLISAWQVTQRIMLLRFVFPSSHTVSIAETKAK